MQGTVRASRVSVKLGFAGADFGYAVDLGLPAAMRSAFDLDPEVKAEATWGGPVLRPGTLLAERKGAVVRIRADRAWEIVPREVQAFDSMLSEVADPVRAPDLLVLRERMRSWRFYDHLRTDSDAPGRQVRVGTRTPVLAGDGSDVAAALQTIREIGDSDGLDAAVERGLPGSRVEIAAVGGGRLEVTLRQHGLLRPLGGAELSDGTLRYLLWVAALLTPRPPELLVLNEPETSLHPDLLDPLGELIAEAAERTQVIVVTHARPLVIALEKRGARTVELVKDFGETRIAGQDPLDGPAWVWPKR